MEDSIASIMLAQGSKTRLELASLPFRLAPRRLGGARDIRGSTGGCGRGIGLLHRLVYLGLRTLTRRALFHSALLRTQYARLGGLNTLPQLGDLPRGFRACLQKSAGSGPVACAL